MTPTKMATKLNSPPPLTSTTSTKSSSVVDKKSAEIRRRSSARYSILSDPRLSQLFALSTQLEALAHSIELEAAVTAAGAVSSASTDSTKPPELPPKPKFGNSIYDRSNGNVVSTLKSRRNPPPPTPPKPNQYLDKKSTEIQYTRLQNSSETVDEVLNFFDYDYENLFEEDEEEEENGDGAPTLDLIPPPRYSTISDSRMSTSSQAESTPSANSVLSDSCPTMKAEFDSRDEVDEQELLWPDVEDRLEDQPMPKTESEWQARCMELEMALQRFRDQAQNIRELLREKLSELEQRVVEAETRAEDAEDKVRVMERRLNEVDWTPTELSQRAEEFQTGLLEKDRLIQTLESEVEQQRQLRLSDAKAVEAKAARIKDWVTNKLRELEEQNAHLKAQNAKASDQMELLRNRLEQLQAFNASTAAMSKSGKGRADSMAEQDSSLGSFEGEPVVSDESLPEIGLRAARADGAGSASSAAGGGGQTLTSRRSFQQRPVTASIDQVLYENSPCGGSSGNSLSSRQSGRISYGPTSSKTPAQRVVSADTSLSRNLCSGLTDLTTAGTAAPRRELNTAASALRDSRVDSGSVDLETPPDASPLGDESRPVPPPRLTKLATSTSEAPISSKDDDVTECDDLDRRASAHVTPMVMVGLPKKLKQRLVMSDEMHDYSEIYTPSNEDGGKVRPWTEETTEGTTASTTSVSVGSSRSGGGRAGSGDSGPIVSVHPPPPPPVHRYPSWEDRIYRIANEGMNASTEEVAFGAGSDSRNNNSESRLSANFGGGFGEDISVPVYATIKGRASQIRSIPFTGESTDSDSDGGGGQGPDDAHHHSENMARDQSYDSEMSNDYAIPPDASDGGSMIPATPSRLSNYADSPRKCGTEKALEKSGYLTKLGGKIKSWKRRYFVLKNGTLSYWKSQHDTHRKPQGLIVLEDTCRVSRSDGANTFEITTASKTYYLTADSQPLMEEWVRVLQNVVQRNALKLLLSREDHKPTLQGWLAKVKHGHARKVWCLLIGKIFVYFRTPNDPNPLGQLNMRDTRVEEVEHISDSDSDETEDAASKRPTLGIFPNHIQQGPTYLIFSSKAEKEKWLYHLTVVSGGDPKAGTQFEQLVQKLMEEDGDPQSAVWRNPLMVYSKDPIAAPLTTFTSETLQTEALKLFKSLLLFTSVVMDSAGIDYHVMLAANAIQQCLDVPELQPELLCALIKQTSRPSQAKHGVQSFLMNATQLFSCDSSGAQKMSPPGSTPAQNLGPQGPDGKSNPCVFIQGWMLMSIAVSIFVPKSSKLLWFLRTHFNRNKETKTETGKYAAYCARALERAVTNGPRQAKPSRMEVLSILLKNPHHHSLPHALPVHFLNDTYQVVGFDGSTTIAEFLNDLIQEIGCRPVELSGFTIHSDDPIDKDLDHALHLEDKVCDVISRWETALREKGMGKFENKRVIRFVYKNRLFWRKNVPGEVDKERLLECYQVIQQIVLGKFPLNKELALELAALMAQIHFGGSSSSNPDKNSVPSNPKHVVAEALDRFFPIRYRESEDRETLENNLLEKWSALKGKNGHDCVRIFLTCTRKWQFFGAKLFEVQTVSSSGYPENSVWLAVGEDGVAILDQTSMHPLERYPYDSVVTFGGCQDDFMLVVARDFDVFDDDLDDEDDLEFDENMRRSQRRNTKDSSDTIRLLFHAGKPQILQITLLVADYMNMMGKTAPGLLSGAAGTAGTTTPGSASATPKSTTLSRGQSSSRASSRARMQLPGTPALSDQHHHHHRSISTAPNTPRPDRSTSDCHLLISRTISSNSGEKTGLSQTKKRQQPHENGVV